MIDWPKQFKLHHAIAGFFCHISATAGQSATAQPQKPRHNNQLGLRIGLVNVSYHRSAVSTHSANTGETLQISLSIRWMNAVEKPQQRTQSVRHSCMQTKEFLHGIVRKCNQLCVAHFINAGVQRLAI
eukprot:scaffold340213_cov18-Prasinocladus_malaysianus.AAC.1